MKWLFLISFLVISFAFADEEFKSNFKFQNKDTLTFEDLKYDTVLHKCILNDLNIKYQNTITDKIKKNKLSIDSIYLYHCYSYQAENNKYKTISLFISGDFLNKLYLVTVNKNNELLDYYKIGEELELVPYIDKYSSEKQLVKAIRISNNKYKILNYKWTKISFPDGTSDTLNYKIETSYIKIDSKGKF